MGAILSLAVGAECLSTVRALSEPERLPLRLGGILVPPVAAACCVAELFLFPVGGLRHGLTAEKTTPNYSVRRDGQGLSVRLFPFGIWPARAEYEALHCVDR